MLPLHTHKRRHNLASNETPGRGIKNVCVFLGLKKIPSQVDTFDHAEMLGAVPSHVAVKDRPAREV